MMDSLMDNCSFMKKDIDASALTWNLYAFKYLVKKSDKTVLTDKVVTGGTDKDEAEKEAIDILRKKYGKQADIVMMKWIQLGGGEGKQHEQKYHTKLRKGNPYGQLSLGCEKGIYSLFVESLDCCYLGNVQVHEHPFSFPYEKDPLGSY